MSDDAVGVGRPRGVMRLLGPGVLLGNLSGSDILELLERGGESGVSRMPIPVSSWTGSSG